MASNAQFPEGIPNLQSLQAEAEANGEDESLPRTIPGIDHLDEWMIDELERKKIFIGYLEQIGDEDVAEIKEYWFPNGMDAVPNLEPYKKFLKHKEEEEVDEETLKREEAEFIERSDPLHIDRGMARVANVFKNVGSQIASYWKSTLRPTLSIGKKTPEEIANEPLPLKIISSPYWLMGISLVYVGASYNLYRSFGHKLNSVLMSYTFYKSAKMINNNEMNGYKWATAATAAAFLTSISTTSQRRDLAPMFRPKYVGPRYFTVISIPFFIYYYNRIQNVPLVKEVKEAKEYIIQTAYDARTWFQGLGSRFRKDREAIEALEQQHEEDEGEDFLKEISSAKKQELKSMKGRQGSVGSTDDDE